MANNIQNVVDIVFQARNQASATIKSLNSQLKGIAKSTEIFGKVMSQAGELGRKSIQGMNVEPLMQKLKAVGKTAGITGKQIQQSFEQGKRSMQSFNMNLLSVMFGGMMLQRTFGRVGRASVDAFTKVMATVEGATTSVSMASTAFEYLKFTVGQAIDTALAPFMPFILRIVEGFANIIEQNPALVFWSIAGAFATGTALAVGGSFGLFVQGMANLVGLNFQKIGGLPGVFKAIGTAASAHPIVAAFVASLTALSLLSWKSFKETPEAWESIKNTISGLKDPVKDLVDEFSLLLNNMGLNINIWEDFAWIVAWGASNLGKSIEIILNWLTGLLQGMNLVIDAAQAMWAAIRGEDGESVSDLKNKLDEVYKTLVTDAADLWKDLGKNIIAGPTGFKENFLQSQANDAIKRNLLPGQSMSTAEGIQTRPQQNQYNFNIQIKEAYGDKRAMEQLTRNLYAQISSRLGN